MKNKEKYKNEIFKKWSSVCGKDFCDDFVAPVILKKYGLYCCDDNDCDPYHGTKLLCTQCQIIQSLWLEEEYDETENAIDWTKVEKDTPVYVKRKNEIDWKRRYFSHYEDGVIYCFPVGQTSWSSKAESQNAVVLWDCGKLAEEKNENEIID